MSNVPLRFRLRKFGTGLTATTLDGNTEVPLYLEPKWIRGEGMDLLNLSSGTLAERIAVVLEAAGLHPVGAKVRVPCNPDDVPTYVLRYRLELEKGELELTCDVWDDDAFDDLDHCDAFSPDEAAALERVA